MQQSGHHFQPHDQKAQETNFHLIFRTLIDSSAHTNVSLSSKGRESHPTSFHTNVSLSSMQQDGHHFQAYTIKKDRRQTSTQIFEGIAIPTSCHTNVSLGTNVSLSSRQPSSDQHCLQSLPNNTGSIPKFLEASHRHHYF